MDRETANRLADQLIANGHSADITNRSDESGPGVRRKGLGMFYLPLLTTGIATAIALENGTHTIVAIMLGMCVGLAFAFVMINSASKNDEG